MAASQDAASQNRQEKRRELDSRRSKCRIRLGGLMEQWCLLKEQLGFSLHSQLAKFLLDRFVVKHSLWGYTSSGSVFCTGPEPLPSKGLQYLVLLSHTHSQECNLVPGLQGSVSRDGGLVWECSAGHTFSWCPSSGPTSSEDPKAVPLPNIGQRNLCLGNQKPAGLESEHDEGTLETRMLRGVAFPPKTCLTLEKDKKEEEEEEEEMFNDAAPWTSPDDREPDSSGPPSSPLTQAFKERRTPSIPAATSALAVPSSSAASLNSRASLPLEVRVQLELSTSSQVSQDTEPLTSSGSHTQSTVTSVCNEDTDAAQIGPKRIRKAAKRELLPCDFPGCGRIFSNRQYLNHHKKYQHIYQKSFSCPEPACGKSFNFKKHLKEHIKLHSDTRDYICEFCARSFRTSSNLVIHRRIHTGEKPLQCEICGFTCRQKASLNWHRRKHTETEAALCFPCEFCGKRFEKPNSVAAHCSKSHPAVLLSLQKTLEPCPSISNTVIMGSSQGSSHSLAL
ncbi:zinc finger protein 692 [Suncus etruscus]|uniref:zinc finger protein 692 n=1 Tax=Suncus etruscus TaxID=109475 RepID=UPI00210F6B40|nr:zinc finger protein 692 [Suncus etruscus]